MLPSNYGHEGNKLYVSFQTLKVTAGIKQLCCRGG